VPEGRSSESPGMPRPEDVLKRWTQETSAAF